LILLRHDKQREIGWPEADPEWLAGRNHPGEKTRKCGDPLEIRVTVVGSVLQEGDSRGGAELRSMVQLQA
jgi:hypothetical protein